MGDDAGADGGEEGFSEAAERSPGNPWVVQGINAVLSTTFALVIVGGLGFIGAMEFTPVNLATVAVIIFTVSYIVTQ